MLKRPHRIIVCEKSPERQRFVCEHYPEVEVCAPGECREYVMRRSEHGGADRVIEVAGADDTFRLAWECARPNAIVTVVALYDRPQLLPLPDMYGKNLTFKTGGVDGCDCAEILDLIGQGLIDPTPLITHRFPLSRIDEAYRLFENHEDGVIKGCRRVRQVGPTVSRWRSQVTIYSSMTFRIINSSTICYVKTAPVLSRTPFFLKVGREVRARRLSAGL